MSWSWASLSWLNLFQLFCHFRLLWLYYPLVWLALDSTLFRLLPPIFFLGLFSHPEIEFFIRLVSNFFFSPSPPQVRHVKVLQPKCTRELLQLVQAKGFGEDIGSV